MNLHRRHRVFAVALLVGGPALAQQDLPKKPLTIVVGFDNKPGAGGNIAHELVARAPADGTVILLGSVGPLKSPDVSDELTGAGLLPAPGTRDELARTIAQESRTWGKVIADRKITAE